MNKHAVEGPLVEALQEVYFGDAPTTTILRSIMRNFDEVVDALDAEAHNVMDSDPECYFSAIEVDVPDDWAYPGPAEIADPPVPVETCTCEPAHGSTVIVGNEAHATTRGVVVEFTMVLRVPVRLLLPLAET
jgi:hypothetical protein